MWRRLQTAQSQAQVHLEEDEHTEDCEQRRSDESHLAQRKALCERLTEHDGGNVRNHHAECGAYRDREEIAELSTESDGCKLRLVAHFGEKEHYQRRQERAVPGCVLLGFVERIGNQGPGGEGEEGDTEDP